MDLQETYQFKRIINYIPKKLYKLSLKFSSGIIFQNPDDEQLFKNLNIITNKKTHVVNGSGVDLEYYSPTKLPSQNTFLMLSRLVADKGVMEYCEAAEKFEQKSRHLI